MDGWSDLPTATQSASSPHGLTRWCPQLPLSLAQLTLGTEPLKGPDGSAFTSRLLSGRHAGMDSLSPALRRSGKSQMAEPGPFPRARAAQMSGQSWHRCPRFLTCSPRAQGSQAAALEAEPDHRPWGRSLAGRRGPGQGAPGPGSTPGVSAMSHRRARRGRWAGSGALGHLREDRGSKRAVQGFWVIGRQGLECQLLTASHGKAWSPPPGI